MYINWERRDQIELFHDVYKCRECNKVHGNVNEYQGDVIPLVCGCMDDHYGAEFKSSYSKANEQGITL